MDDAFEDEAEPTITIGEYIDEIEAAEREADLVLGGDEGNECTYASGYMKRQAIFSCLTCVPGGNAGVCTACSLTCHDGHEIVELWTKRKFRCDCGNSKFGDFVCKLYANKDPENPENSYNHNFKGAYCTCGRPYPDPDTEEQVEMIQCCICEDWFHENHLGLNSIDEIPRDDEGETLYEDFICQKCAVTFSFLKLYPPSIWASPKQKNALHISSDDPNVLEHGSSSSSNPEDIDNGVVVCKISENDLNTDSKCENVSNEDSICSKITDNNTTLMEPKTSDHNVELDLKCSLEVDINATTLELDREGPLFLSRKWRDVLCKCQACTNFYSQKGVAYLIDQEDSIEEYEKMAKQKRAKTLEQQKGAELNFLNNLNHIQKIEILGALTDMEDEFRSFLQSYDSSKPVTSEDIRGIFENLAKKKKQRFS
ncbi:putative E3 ubiquitin-protein ligase UBR7 isoform X1 [Ananas comosus]|uniref:E3 ubiquitin-protein ligase UBR7 isoform X1 n=1 Tax=Ananas comosus TaxID=4615 RepID=A0A199V1M3_ANACO|nr:putative E3 ubiquitin-protein ligase UBR7 isoform X1 [Ananas comosus]OAY70982.1 putative E3 ubiquitin-protein ligase UBR7 [Ananas comosus]